MGWRGTPDEALVYSAAEMVATQSGCSLDEAIDLLINRAVETTRTVPDAARLVLVGVLRFDGQL
jgi:flavin-binding protein dodecin